MQHRVRQSHVASLDIRDGRLAAEGAADVVEHPRRDAGLSAKKVPTDGKRRVGGISFDGPPDLHTSPFGPRRHVCSPHYLLAETALQPDVSSSDAIMASSCG